MLDENRQLPKVISKALDLRPRCWHCGLLLNNGKLQLTAKYHNQCLAKKYAAPPIEFDYQPQVIQPRRYITSDLAFIKYIDRVLGPKPVKTDTVIIE